MAAGRRDGGKKPVTKPSCPGLFGADASSDDDSYYYAIAGKPFVRFDVIAFDKNVSLQEIVLPS